MPKEPNIQILDPESDADVAIIRLAHSHQDVQIAFHEKLNIAQGHTIAGGYEIHLEENQYFEVRLDQRHNRYVILIQTRRT